MRKAEPSVRPSPDLFRVVVVLTIILPEAYWADFVASPSMKGLVSAAGAAICLHLFGRFVHVLEHDEMIAYLA